MGVAWYWARAELRRRTATWVSIALLLGIGGGLAMGSLAAARRTDSAYPRFLAAADAPDLVLDPGFEVDGKEFLDVVLALPGVADRTDAQAVALGEIVDGRIEIAGLGTTVASVDGIRFYERDRVHVVEGRMPAPDRTGEVLVSHTVAAEGVAVGDLLTYGVLDAGAMFGVLEAGDQQLSVDDAARVVEVEVTGIGVFPELAVTEDALAPDVVMVTPALFDDLPDESHLWSRAGIHLAPGADPGAVKRAIKELAAERGGDVFFEDRASIAHRAQRAARPYVLGLAGLGAAGALFVLLSATQLVRRSTLRSRSDGQVMVALGAPGRLVRAGAAAPALVAGVAAAVVAVAGQGAISRLTPVGPVAAIDPEPGMQLDWVVAAPGAALLVAVSVASASVFGRRSGFVPARVDALSRRVAQAGAPVAVVLGLGKAVGGGDGSHRGAARSGLLAVALATTMLVAVVTFGASMRQLVDHPEVHGWNADVGLLGAGGYGNFDLRAAAGIDGVDALSGGVFGSVGIEASTVPGLAIVQLRGDLLPPIVDGRAPAAPAEIALGRRTMAEIGARLGDVVDVRIPGQEAGPMTVVGTTVLPGLGPIDNDRPTLGDGALLVLPLEVAESDGFGWSLILADLQSNADREAVVADLVAAAREQAGDTEVFHLFRPADIQSFAEVGAVPVLLVGLFGLVAAGSLVHVLLVTGRGWRRDRAVLATIGATPDQLRDAVRWQALLVVALALAAALPVGSALGRWSWRSLAEEVGIVPDPVVPTSALAVLVPSLLLVALGVTSVAERRATKFRPIDHLRPE